MKCISNKKMYPTLETAQDALIQAWITYHYAPNTGPVTVYRCEDCGQYHFTSKGGMDEKLAQYLAQGKIQRQRESDYWIRKIKK